MQKVALARSSPPGWRIWMRLHGITFLTCAVAGWLMAAEPAQACTCSGPANPAEALERSSAVFRGKVVEISRPFLDRIGLTKSGGHRVKFEVLKRWKGASSKMAAVITRLTGEACGFPFEIGKEYLVYVVAEPRDIQTGICTGTKTAAEAESEMKQLDKLRNRPR